MAIESTAALAPDELNPRKITKEQKENLLASLEKFGDLSGIVFNRRTRTLVGGHQRTSLFGPDCPIEAKYFPKDHQGTVGLGYITLKDGSKHSYREVDWEKDFAYAANIAANAHGGNWDEEKLRTVLKLVSEDETITQKEIGLETDFMENLFRGDKSGFNVQAQESQSLTSPLTSKEMMNLPSQVALVQLFYTTATRPGIIEKAKKLETLLGTANISETVAKALEIALDTHAAKQAIVP
jgi:hypothetical protein